MKLTFILVAEALAAGAVVLLLWPLLRRRADSLPASGASAWVVALVILLGGLLLYAGFSSYQWVQQESVSNTPAARKRDSYRSAS